MAEIAVAVASEVAKCLVAPVGRHCGYVIYSDRRVCELNVEVKKLGEKKDEVQRSIDDAQNNMKPIKAMVETWVTEVETAANKARDVLDYDGSAQKTCFYGWLPNPKARYRLGNEASKMIKEIKDLIVLGQFERVYDENSPPGRVDSTPRVNSSAGDGGNTLFKSQASTFQDVIKALCDEKHKVIGVYGPGGVGKTTLLEIVEEELKKKGKPFRMIVKSEVSQNPDVTKIQYDIAYGLDLKDLKNEPSEKGRRDLLSKRLQMNPSEKVLIILDDVWAELDLKAVGIPLGNESMNCKLLLTSRDERVLQRMLADQTFPLKSLEEEEALKLFETIVGDRLRDDKELKVKAAQVVTKLAGLPLLITSVATILKRSNVSTWENMLRKIEDPNIERIVKWSYDHVESEDAKCLFLLCGLIGGTIKVELLLGLGMGLGLFEGYNERVQYSRNRLNEMLDSLHSFCLLQDGGDGKKNVTIHDLYSEVVVSYAFRGQDSLMMNSNYGPRSKEKLEKCWAICLADVDKDRLDKLMMCRFPDLKILMLSEPKGWHKRKVGDCSGLLDFTYMKELRVLYFRFMRIASLPPSIGILENLHSLYLDDCNVKDVAILGKLKALQILSFTRSTISRLPKEIGELTNLRSLNLSKCYKLETIEPDVLKGLTNLEELRIYSFSQWMGKDQIPSKSCNARLAELKSLTKLFALEIIILDPTILLEDGDLPFGNLDRFEIDIGQFHELKFKDLRIMKLDLEGCESILLKEWVQKTLQKTQCLLLGNLSEFKKSAHELCTQGFEEVKYINIKDSPSIKYIANSSDGLPLTAFRMLESLILERLIKLEKICNGPVTPESFSKLRAISVTWCHRLKYLWSLSDWQRLIQLEEIEVQKCDSMQSIVTYDAGEGIVSTNDRVELPSVRRLRLLELPNMMSFCTKAESASEDTPIQVSLPLLESLEMNGLLGLEKILYSEPSLKYSNLRSLVINNSRSTSKSILKLDWILKLPNLESMDIAKSPSAEVVFDLEELKDRGDVEILSQLAELTLNQLPNLQCLWKPDVKLQGISILRNLRDLYIHTTLLSFLFSVSVAKYVREIEIIEVDNCPNMKAVIVDEGRNEGTYDIIEFPILECLTIRNCSMEKFFSYPCGKKEPVTTTLDSQDANSDSFFDQKVSLPNLNYLQLHSVGSFKRIWPNELSRSSLCKLDIINVENCSDLLHIFPSTIVGRLHNLKSVEVKNCPSLKSLFDFGSLDSNTEQNAVLLPELVKIDVESCPSLESLLNCGSLDSNAEHKIISVPKLEKVRVSRAKKLRHVVMSHSQMVLNFPSLTTVSVENCSDLRYLFSKYSATSLMKLQRLEITKCEQMREVILEKEAGRSEEEVISFPCLSELTLKELDNLISFGSGSVKRQLGEIAKENDESPQPLFNEMVTFPNMRYLEIEGIPCKELWNNHVPADSIVCSHRFLLRKVKVINCPSLKSLFDFGSLDSNTEQNTVLLPELVRIDVESCPSLELLFNCGSPDSNTEHKIILVPKLEEVRVNGAKKLRHVVMSRSQMVLNFPSLTTVSVENCSDLRYLFSKYSATSLMKLHRLEITKCEQMKEVILEKEAGRSKEEVMSFPCLSELMLKELDNLISFGLGSVKRQLGETAEENDESPQPLFNKMVTFPNMRYLEIEGIPCKELWNNHVPTDSIVCSHKLLLRVVKVKNCQSLKSLLDFGSLDSNTEQNAVLLPELVKIDVESCPSLESLLNCGSLNSNTEHEIILVPKLEEVRVSGAKRLRHVVMSHSQMVLNFPSLTTVNVENCSDLRYLFSKYSATSLMKLKRLEITKCEQMKEVILEKEAGRSEEEVMSFPCLSELILKELDNLISFSSGSVKRQLGETAEENDESPQPLFNKMVTFPNIISLKINGLRCKELWNNHVPADSIVCSHRFLLENVKVKNCPSLKSLFDFGSLDSNAEQNAVLLPELVKIDVESCPSLESLLNCGSLDSNAEHKIILIPKLEEVRVSGAKKLRHMVMSHSQMVLNFPSLTTVSVENCSDLRYLFSKYSATSLMKLQRLEITKCEQMKEVILEKEASRSKEEVMSFPCLSALILKELNNLISFSLGSVKRQLGETAEENDESPQPLFNKMVTFPNMRYLEIEGIPCKELWNKHVPADSIVCSHRPLLRVVKVKNCPSLKSLLDFGSLDSNTEQNAVLLLELVKIDVESCPSLESLLNCGSLDSNAEHKIILVPKLEEVRVSGAKKLRHVVMSHSQIVLNFPSLRTVSVENCSDLRYLFSKYSATSLMKLKRLEITKCEQMKEVILEKEAGRSEEEVMSFPCLSELILKELDNLISFSSGSVKRQLSETAEENDESPQLLFNKMVTFPNIIILEINGLRCKELWNNQTPTDSFQKLEYLLLNNCHNLQRIATSYMWKRLQRCLEKLEVISCCLIEIIYEGDGTDIESGKLRRLVLRGLENLRRIWQYDSLPNMPFPNLRDVEAVRCPHLEILFPTFTAKFLGQIKELVVESCENMELIAGHEKWEEATGTTITFSELTSLRLFELSKFKSFLPEKYSLKFLCSKDFPSLQVLSIESCGAEPDQVLGDWLYHKTEQEHCSAHRRLMRIKHPPRIFHHWPPLDMAR